MAKRATHKTVLNPALPIYQLHISLNHSDPPIWRRVQVDDCSLADLHEIIQVCMGWEDEHLHAFDVDGEQYGNPQHGGDPEDRDSRRIWLSDLVAEGCKKFLYWYDFGDDWKHTIKMEKTLPQEPQVRYPRCVDGARACPPEDCGGVWGYADLLESLRDPDAEEHEERLEWLGEDFDPEEFDVGSVNQELDHVRSWLGRKPGKHFPAPKFTVGAAVRVKSGAVHPEYLDIPLGGWAGTIAKVTYLTPVGYLVRWSAETLAAAHPVYGTRRRRDQRKPAEQWLDEAVLEPDSGGPLAIEQPTAIVTRPLSADDPEDRIRAIFALSSDDPLPDPNDQQSERRYGAYLAAKLTFPFEARYFDIGEGGQGRDRRVTVTGLSDKVPEDFLNGILCKAREGKRSCQVHLGNVQVADDNPLCQLLEDYRYWLWESGDTGDFDEGEEDLDDEDEGEEEDFDDADDWDEEDDEDEEDWFLDEQDKGTKRNAGLRFPIGTVALYGPDDKTTTKIAAGVIMHEGAEVILERWVGTNVKSSPKVSREIDEFFGRHGVRSLVVSKGNVGCPHEEGENFPMGEDCPFCPYWRGQQGSARRE